MREIMNGERLHQACHPLGVEHSFL
jgi:hypothetical protein